jgi:hypothetical protein
VLSSTQITDDIVVVKIEKEYIINDVHEKSAMILFRNQLTTVNAHLLVAVLDPPTS